MNAAPKPVTVPLASHHSQDRNPPSMSNRNPNQPTPRNSNKTNKSYSNSNRESLRLEINVTPTKQRPDPDSNREKEAPFFGPSRGGSFLSDPPAFRPRFHRPAPSTEPQTHPIPNDQNSNRESLRLEINVTPTKQRPDPDSNREKEAPFFGPSRGGSFLSDPPAFRPRFRRRAPSAEPQIHPARKHQNSNRESLRLEIKVTPTKQRPDPDSNREPEALVKGPTINAQKHRHPRHSTEENSTKKAPRQIPRGFKIATGISKRPLTAAA
jgi:hypothetical protein